MSRLATVKPVPASSWQPPEESLSVGFLMGRARASLLSALDQQLAPSGVTGMQFGALKHLSAGSARTAADLCRFMQYDAGSMTRIIDRLEEKGLLRRERGREDRRVVFLRLTPAGRTQLPRLAAVAVRVLEAHLAGFSAAEIQTLRNYLGRMIDNGQTQGENRYTGTGGKSS